MITATLKDIRANRPCEEGWIKLLSALGKTKADDERFPLETVLDSNGIEDALWCLRALPDAHGPAVRLLVCNYAESVLHIFETRYPADDRPRKAIETARRFAHGLASQEELAAARNAAWDAERDAAWDEAWDAAWDAERKKQADEFRRFCRGEGEYGEVTPC